MKSFEHLLLGKLFISAKRAGGGQGNLDTHGLIDMNCIALKFFCFMVESYLDCCRISMELGGERKNNRWGCGLAREL